jgi:hypothetical protein
VSQWHFQLGANSDQKGAKSILDNFDEAVLRRIVQVLLRVLYYIVTISFGYILYCVPFHLYCGCFNLFCNVWVCVYVGFIMCVFW